MILFSVIFFNIDASVDQSQIQNVAGLLFLYLLQMSFGGASPILSVSSLLQVFIRHENAQNTS